MVKDTAENQGRGTRRRLSTRRLAGFAGVIAVPAAVFAGPLAVNANAATATYVNDACYLNNGGDQGGITAQYVTNTAWAFSDCSGNANDGWLSAAILNSNGTFGTGQQHGYASYFRNQGSEKGTVAECYLTAANQVSHRLSCEVSWS